MQPERASRIAQEDDMPAWLERWFGYGLGVGVGRALLGEERDASPKPPIVPKTEEEILADEKRFAEDERRLDEADRRFDADRAARDARQHAAPK